MARYSVIDFETTGIHWGAHDRVVEVGISLLDENFDEVDFFETLVNPKRDPGPQHIHGIQASWLLHAPEFNDVYPKMLAMLDGTTVLAHNASFDASFLFSELARAGVYGLGEPSMSSLSPGFRCTKRIAKLVFGTNPQSFEWLCSQLGVTNEHPHAALSDARAAAKVTKLLALESMEVRAHLEDAETFKVPERHLGEAERIHLRAGATAISSLASRIEALPPMMATDSSSDYLAVIFESLADLVLDEFELQKLATTAVNSGISMEEVRDLNRLALLAVSRFFLEDGLLDDSERRVLEALARQLGEDVADLNIDSDQYLKLTDFTIHSVLRPPVGGQYVLTGFSESRKRELTQLFVEMQLEVKSSVSKRTLGVIALDPDSQSGKATKARQLGIPVLGQQVIPFIRTQGTG